MKKAVIILLGLIIFSCHFDAKKNELNSNSSMVKDSLEAVKLIETNDEKETFSYLTKPIVNKSPKNSKSIYILDSLKIDLYALIDTVRKYNPNLPIIYPTELDDNLDPVFQLNDSTLLISFFIDSDFEKTRFTSWKLKHDSNLSYQGKLKPDFYTKYSCVKILQQATINQNTFLIGETSGGEGGENWQSIWVSQLSDQDSILEIGHHSSGYDADENMRKLEFDISGNNVLIYEKIYSTPFTTDSLKLLKYSKKQVNKISID